MCWRSLRSQFPSLIVSPRPPPVVDPVPKRERVQNLGPPQVEKGRLMKNSRLLCAVAVITAAMTIVSAQAYACTAFQLTSNDGAKIYFRSMEFGFPFHSQVVVVPRGTQYTGTTPNGKPGLKWVT